MEGAEGGVRACGRCGGGIMTGEIIALNKQALGLPAAQKITLSYNPRPD